MEARALQLWDSYLLQNPRLPALCTDALQSLLSCRPLRLAPWLDTSTITVADYYSLLDRASGDHGTVLVARPFRVDTCDRE